MWLYFSLRVIPNEDLEMNRRRQAGLSAASATSAAKTASTAAAKQEKVDINAARMNLKETDHRKCAQFKVQHLIFMFKLSYFMRLYALNIVDDSDSDVGDTGGGARVSSSIQETFAVSHDFYSHQ
jgi:hypothetical protein